MVESNLEKQSTGTVLKKKLKKTGISCILCLHVSRLGWKLLCYVLFFLSYQITLFKAIVRLSGPKPCASHNSRPRGPNRKGQLGSIPGRAFDCVLWLKLNHLLFLFSFLDHFCLLQPMTLSLFFLSWETFTWSFTGTSRAGVSWLFPVMLSVDVCLFLPIVSYLYRLYDDVLRVVQ